MHPKRNELCTCGSGKKYKACCASRPAPRQRIALVGLVLFGLAAWVLAGVVRRIGTGAPNEAVGGDEAGPAPPGKVWSEEHGHWHDAPAPGGVQPPGPVPLGKVWSAEHGHWHDAPAPGPSPGGQAPPGKVWSAEHGHWHDAPAPAAAAEPLPEESVSAVEEP